MHGALNEPQRLAVEHGDGPLLVLAGAGTGKTRVLVHRIAELVDRGVPPWAILAVTFTNKAAGEMRDRLLALLGEPARGMWIGTFHGICARLLRRWGEHVGLAPDFQILDDDDQLKIVAALLKEHGEDDAVSPRSLLTRFDRAKNRGEDPAAARGDHYLDAFAARLYPLYAQRLAREQAVDFNDLLLKVRELQAHPEAGPRLAAMFAHVLVDEFQDTNRVQFELAVGLARATRNLTAVGDDDQSIYGWRGADPRNMFDFEREFPEATVIRLEQNYRSTAVILEAANAVIARNRQRHPKALWTEQAGGEPITWYEAGDDRGEAWFVADRIARLVTEEGLSPGDVACLYRTHAQSRALEEALLRVGVRSRIVGGVGFYERREVKDALAYLRLVAAPRSDTSLERVINVPARGIGDTTVAKLRALAAAHDTSLLEAARRAARDGAGGLAAAARRKLGGFVELIDGLRAVLAAGASISELAIQVVERSRYREVLEADDTQEARDRLSNLAELVTVAADYDDAAGGEGTLAGFLEQVTLASSAEELSERAMTPQERAELRTRSVVLSTVHAAKGLEFPVVFLCGMEDGLFPSLREREERDDEASLEEERRLAYVAITRARDRLALTAARTRRVWGTVRFQAPSRFLDDIPASCMPRARRGGVTGGVTGGGEPRFGGPASGALLGVRPVAAPPAGTRARRGWGSPHDDHDQRGPGDDEPSYELDGDRRQPRTREERLGPGAAVRHAVFGDGIVAEAQGEGRDRRLVVRFAGAGAKTVLARFVEATGDDAGRDDG